MNIFKRSLHILTSPREFFRGLKETGLKRAWLFFAVMYLFYAALGFIVGYLLQPFFTGLSASIVGVPAELLAAEVDVGFGVQMAGALFGYFLGLGLVFVGAGILHVWIILFGGRANYKKTFQLGVYSSVPLYLFGWIPFLNLFANIYGVILLIIGTQEIHRISKIKSILMYVIPLAIILIIALGMIIFAIVALQNAGPIDFGN